MSGRVLIADDSDDVRMLLRLLINTSNGLELVGEAISTATALDAVRDLQPDAVVLDQSFGEVRVGTDIIAELRVHAPDVKVLLFTAYSLSEEVLAHARPDAFLLKTDTSSVVPTLKRLTGAE